MRSTFSISSARRGRAARLLCLLSVFLVAGGSAQAQKLAPPVRFRQVAPDVFVHTSYHKPPGTTAPVAANGLIVRTSTGALLVDTGWNSDQTLQILRWVADSLHQHVRMAVVTHAHEDRLGGIAALRANHIRVLGSPLTAKLALAQQLDAPTPSIQPYTLIRAGRTRLEVFFPGPGHAPDNVVVWLPRQRVLFGGSLLKDATATTLGNIADADLKQWPAAVRKVATHYPKAQVVVPGNGAPGGPELFTHTLRLLRPGSNPQTRTALNSK